MGEYNPITEYVEGRKDIGTQTMHNADSFCEGDRKLGYFNQALATILEVLLEHERRPRIA
jgi:hypothetical protein